MRKHPAGPHVDAGEDERGDRLPKLPVAPRELAGKTKPEPEVIRWVARAIDDPTVTAKDCPDPFAWTLLRMCREDPSFVVFFLEKLWAKLLPSRAQVDSGPGVELDGQPTIDLIDRILRMKEDAEGGRRFRPAKAPPPIPRGAALGAFDEFEPGKEEGDEG